MSNAPETQAALLSGDPNSCRSRRDSLTWLPATRYLLPFTTKTAAESAASGQIVRELLHSAVAIDRRWSSKLFASRLI